NLEIPIVTGDHQQLLVKLRRLRQRVELARMHAARHQVIARAFGRRLREYRCFDLEISTLVEKTTRCLLKTMSKKEILLQLRTAKIEIAMTKSQVLRSKLVRFSASNRDRRDFSFGKNFELSRLQLDFSGFQLWIAGFLRTERHCARYSHHVFLAE